MRLRLTFADQDFTATLADNPSVRDLMSMLPLDLTISDYSTNEKIASLPRKLTEEGSGQSRMRLSAISVTLPHGAIWRCSTGPIAGLGG